MSLDINVTYILVLALFIVPLLVLNFFAFRPFMDLFEARYAKLEGALEKANEMLKSADEKAATFNEKIRVATHKGIEARNTVRKQSTDAMNARVESERSRVQASLKAALSELAEKRGQALSAVEKEAHLIAELAANKLLGRSVRA